MARYKYSRWLKLKIAKEAMLPENQGLEHVIAEKYHLQDVGEENAFRKGGSLNRGPTPKREEIEILKKAAAFLANVKRD